MSGYDVIVVGGGLAGLTAALHLSSEGFRILVLEKHPYPRHKVCGEYLSNEVAQYLRHLGVDFGNSVAIDTLELSSVEGTLLTTRLPLGGMGISRYCLDSALYEKAISRGVEVVIQPVTGIVQRDGFYCVTTDQASYEGMIVIGAYGKRSTLDRQLGRPFITGNYPWLAVKAHYRKLGWPANRVGLHAFPGGYAGISQTETGQLNFCYLASYKSFKPHGAIEPYTREVVGKNPNLRIFLEEAEMTFREPLTIAQIAFRKKSAVVNGILMCGDSAGMIHPLCGNGMAMAIHSAKLVSETITKHLRQPDVCLARMGLEYGQLWQRTFAKRLAFGRVFQHLLLRQKTATIMIRVLARSPFLVRNLIRTTHGNPIAYE